MLFLKRCAMINETDKLKFIVNSAQLAAVLEVSSLKPGNVNPLHDFENTRYEHFLAGSISIGNAVFNAAIGGCSEGYNDKIGIGECIFHGVSDVKNSHNGGNTHMGILMLFIPIASACGICISENDLKFRDMQKNVSKILSLTTVDDSANLCSAIKLADAGGLGRVNEFDLNDENLKEELIKNNLNFYNLLKLSANRDRIAQELTTGMEITFEHARVIEKIYDETGGIFPAIVQAYLIILSKFPDTLIVRKCGAETAREVTAEASEVLELGGVFTKKGRVAIENFDKHLRENGNRLNPGTTADIVAASLFIALLNGLEI